VRAYTDPCPARDGLNWGFGPHLAVRLCGGAEKMLGVTRCVGAHWAISRPHHDRLATGGGLSPRDARRSRLANQAVRGRADYVQSVVATRNPVANTSPHNVFQRTQEVYVCYARRWDITADGIDNRTASILTWRNRYLV
jgi:hypothetical protein